MFHTISIGIGAALKGNFGQAMKSGQAQLGTVGIGDFKVEVREQTTPNVPKAASRHAVCQTPLARGPKTSAAASGSDAANQKPYKGNDQGL